VDITVLARCLLAVPGHAWEIRIASTHGARAVSSTKLQRTVQALNSCPTCACGGKLPCSSSQPCAVYCG